MPAKSVRPLATTLERSPFLKGKLAASGMTQRDIIQLQNACFNFVIPVPFRGRTGAARLGFSCRGPGASAYLLGQKWVQSGILGVLRLHRVSFINDTWDSLLKMYQVRVSFVLIFGHPLAELEVNPSKPSSLGMPGSCRETL
uniref:Uncharacterized protein n=1 Tax=Sphaerodactylus townsendi TaxID=933632 RepID=A0ACB8F7X1_9SAUR